MKNFGTLNEFFSNFLFIGDFKTQPLRQQIFGCATDLDSFVSYSPHCQLTIQFNSSAKPTTFFRILFSDINKFFNQIKVQEGYQKIRNNKKLTSL